MFNIKTAHARIVILDCLFITTNTIPFSLWLSANVHTLVMKPLTWTVFIVTLDHTTIFWLWAQTPCCTSVIFFVFWRCSGGEIGRFFYRRVTSSTIKYSSINCSHYVTKCLQKSMSIGILTITILGDELPLLCIPQSHNIYTWPVNLKRDKEVWKYQRVLQWIPELFFYL